MNSYISFFKSSGIRIIWKTTLSPSCDLNYKILAFLLWILLPPSAYIFLDLLVYTSQVKVWSPLLLWSPVLSAFPILIYYPDAMVCPDILRICLLSNVLLLSYWGYTSLVLKFLNNCFY